MRMFSKLELTFVAVAALTIVSSLFAQPPKGTQTPKNVAIPAHYTTIPVPALTYDMPFPGDAQVDLGGGATAFLVPDSTLDLVRFYLYAAEPRMPGKPADVAALRFYSALLKDGGTRALSPARLEDSLEFIAAGLGATRGVWQGEASFDALSKDAPALLALTGDVLLHPRLDTAVFRVMQRGMVEGYKHRYATPGAVLGAAVERVMYGNHPSNWSATDVELKAATTKALGPLVGSGFPRNRMVIGVAGRFDRTAMTAALREFVARFPAFAATSATSTATSSVPAFKGPRDPGVYLVDKPFSQATIRIAAPGIQRPHPDYYRLLVASEIFGGGGFTSRLSQRVRSDEGLAYSVFSGVESDYNRRGTVFAGLQTKAETGAYAVGIILSEMRRMAATDSTGGITEAELARAKDGLLKSLPSLFDSPASTARAFAQSAAWGRPPEHFRNYRQVLESMTRSEVEDAFRRYFRADSMRIIVVGPKSTLTTPDARGKSLADLGPVTEITEQELDQRQ